MTVHARAAAPGTIGIGPSYAFGSTHAPKTASAATATRELMRLRPCTPPEPWISSQ
jgi:hypothetical protein